MPAISKEHSARGSGRKKKKGGLTKKATGEGFVFKGIWGSLEPEERVSFVTGKPLPNQHDMYAYHFSHVLSKARNRYPMFKLYKKNIVLKALGEHMMWEYHKSKIKDDPKWEHVFKLEADLKAEYDEHKREYEQGRAEFYKK
jgi:hypothetical protein